MRALDLYIQGKYVEVWGLKIIQIKPQSFKITLHDRIFYAEWFNSEISYDKTMTWLERRPGWGERTYRISLARPYRNETDVINYYGAEQIWKNSVVNS